MAEIDLTQAEADHLIQMEKHRVSDDVIDFPGPGERVNIPLQSPDRREAFYLDVTRAAVKLTKATFQNRGRQVVVLLRLDIDGALHRNPNGEEVPCPICMCTARDLPINGHSPYPELSPENRTLYDVLSLFMNHCNVTQPPNVQKGLFS